jgi:predicted RNA polymerase sigma factor
VIRLVGDFHVAEEAVQDAFAIALERWPRQGRARGDRRPEAPRRARPLPPAVGRRGRPAAARRPLRHAATSYRRALALVATGPERRYLERRLAEVEAR